MESIQRTLPINPKDKANCLSALLFLWTIPIFKRGYKKALEVADLFQPLRDDKSDLLGDRLDKEWHQEVKSSKKRPSLIKAMMRAFWKEIFFMGVLSFINEFGIRLIQPILLGQLLLYFRLGISKDEDSKNAAIYYGAGLVLLTAIGALTFNHFTLVAFHNGMKLRVAVCSIIYRKALRLSRTALGDTAPGKVVNLLSNDVSRFDIVAIFLHSMWSAPLLTVVVGILLWNEIQYAGLVGIAVVFLVVPIQSYTGKLSSKFRYQTAVRTDERVRFMDEIISGVQVIKMYAWEKPFSKLISLARRLELKIVRKNSHVRALYMTFNLFTTRCAVLCTMITMALSGGDLTASKIFVIMSYYNVIAWTMSQMFVRGVAEIAEAWVSFKRLQKFLEYEEKVVEEKASSTSVKQDFLKEFGLNGNIKEKPNLNGNLAIVPNNITIQLNNVTAKWSESIQSAGSGKLSAETIGTLSSDSYESPTLSNISIDFKRGRLIGIIGSVGAGKSSLLQVILEELPIQNGSLVVQGKISYACQEPWVFAASVRQNILFGQELEKLRYDSVVKACALLKDFEQLENADKTIIGEKGASLSGGQKARINLARAVYREADVYLLDDPLSAVDAHVGKHLFDEVIGPNGRLARRHATRILVTHQVHFLKEADWVVVMSDGKIEMQGKPSDLAKSGINFAELLEQDDEPEDDSTIGHRSGRSSSRSLASSRNTIDGDSESETEDEREIFEEAHRMEASSKGTVKGSVEVNYLKASGSYIVPVIVILLFIITQFSASFADYWVSYWTKQEELRIYYRDHNITVKDITPFDSYLYNETLPVHSLNATLNVTGTETDEPNPVATLLSTHFCMTVLGILVAAIFIVGIIRSVGFYGMSIKASQKLHDGMFNGIVQAPMRFFDTNPSGRILNRFSKDMGSVDELLPKAFLDAGQIILNMVGAIIVTSAVQPLFLIPVLVLGIMFLIIRKIYLRTSKSIKRLEGITRSPVFTHLAASLSGLSTIRAYGAQTELIKEFDAHQDIHTASWYMFISTSTSFGLSLDIICLVFLGCVTFYFVLMDAGTMGGEVGLAITQTMALTGLLQWGIRQSAEVANQLMSVERILEYRDLEPEAEPKKITPIGDDWPKAGKLEFKQVFYRYFDGADAVLKSLSFLIQPCEKIGIVGRTGAGKSSLIGAIFRLAKIEGDIVIDNVNTATVPLQKLRSKVSIIPQDPVLFSGTLRRNLDPFEEYPDSDLWRALEAVELKDIAGGPHGLQAAVAAGGSNFSVGQRQLVCLARAILRNNKILVLDEATANVDPHTDSLIQKTIRERFCDCTVLTIAHRLNTIMDSDRVLVMSFGNVEEFDTAHNLLQIPTGLFRSMVQAAGPQESERLHQLAREKHESSIKQS